MENSINGWLCLDKPAGISSNSAMIKIRKLFNTKTGYIGTLDPFATGILPIALGEARKFIQYVNEDRKTYVFTMVFGVSTDTLDKDGKETEKLDLIPSAENLADLLPSFVGEQEQIPPKFSALKINGRRACDIMRSGQDVTLSSRKINVFSLDLLENRLEDEAHAATLRVVCSKGTYVRSLARDIAEKIGSVAYVKSLRRTQSGFFQIKSAIPLEKLQKIEDTMALLSFVQPLESPLDDIPALYVSEDEAKKLQNGLRIVLKGSRLVESSNVLIFEESGRLFRGIGSFSAANSTVRAVRMCSQK